MEAETTVPERKRRVLIVDPDPVFGQSLEDDFKLRAFEIEAVGTVEEAIARVAASPPDLVVLDLYLSENGALKLLRLWKVQVPALVVILVSGNASLNQVVDAFKEGARKFFVKPVSAGALLDEVYERQDAQVSFGANHHLGLAALHADGVDRFFAISPGLLSVAGFDGYFKMLNPAWEKALGYSVDELCAKPYLDLVHPDDREKATDEAFEIRNGRAVFRFKNRYRCQDGTYRWLDWSATPSPTQQLIYSSARDVTKYVRMEEGLRKDNLQLKKVVASGELLLRESASKNDLMAELGRFKDELAAMIVHDLKNPLSVIVSNYEYIIENFEGSAACLEALQDSQNAGKRMLRLLANLVDISRMEDGTIQVRRTDATLSSLLDLVAGQRRVIARSRRITIVSAPPSHLRVPVDIDLMTRVIENIFDNGLRHTPAGGQIAIDLRAVGPDVELRIGNSGFSIPLAARETIFQKYRQATSDAGHMNLGLGLYFCRLVVEAHGGRIWVEETVTLPTVFCIRLPRSATAELVDAPAAAGAIVPLA
jgi:PAS domain S-box-containing protein